ncbi:amidohydrolase/deacetylase family metallohydrolase [Streptomyces diacarni]|uniref:Amidohydrolase/deacetylase family metallohydrolase n=1 Tax=Streptomyces diacarni TaxID=2800381 RepID=A0A367F5I4_9ACTN|nr:amidohydrolase/deacetylase family metallohydrolase [Streptomyces diacarni]RCG24790.1 amidohydrolase/deacetylase family metallohydrolase [Streptomyces diacarni]
MYELLVSGGLLADPERGTIQRGDLAVQHGRIARLGAPGSLEAQQTVDATGLLVSPGLIDLHTHVYPRRTALGVPADSAGVERGVTTVVDAGSCGSDDWTHFRAHVIAPARTRVRAWLNVSRHGLVKGHAELSGGRRDLDPEASDALLRAEPGTVCGLKIRMSRSVLGDSGLAPLRAAKELAGAHGLPVMVHVGNEPPALGEVLELLGDGDVVTHAFHGKPGGLFGTGPEPLPQVWAALERGVRLDVGHGSASFAFRTARRALAAGIRPWTASTDLHNRNTDGPVHSLTETLSKLLALGMPLTEVLACATSRAARVLGAGDDLGTLRPGALADLSLLELRDGPVTLADADGEQYEGDHRLLPRGAVVAGRPHLVAHREETV